MSQYADCTPCIAARNGARETPCATTACSAIGSNRNTTNGMQPAIITTETPTSMRPHPDGVTPYDPVRSADFIMSRPT
ncbi:MAG: hypothetical protein ACQSGP_17290, partial [Frankia sp.]